MKKVCALLLIFSSLLPITCLAEEENHLAVNIWGMSRHMQKGGTNSLNEENWGLGIRAYHGNWFVGFDALKNSVNGQARTYGIGYEYPLFTYEGFTLSAEAEYVHVDYDFPRWGTASGAGLLPGLSVRKGDWTGHMTVIPSGTGSQTTAVLLFFVTYHFGAF